MTLVRKSNCCWPQWKDVHLDQHKWHIPVENSKTGKTPHRLPVPPGRNTVSGTQNPGQRQRLGPGRPQHPLTKPSALKVSLQNQSIPLLPSTTCAAPPPPCCTNRTGRRMWWKKPSTTHRRYARRLAGRSIRGSGRRCCRPGRIQRWIWHRPAIWSLIRKKADVGLFPFPSRVFNFNRPFFWLGPFKLSDNSP